MVAERITPEAVRSGVDLLDGEDRLVLGDVVVVSIGFTNAAVKTLLAREMEEVAAYLVALLERAPLRTSAAYAPHRIVLGSLATELRGFARAAGEPVGLLADLRAAGSLAEERRIRERLADHVIAHERYLDDAIVAHHARSSHPGATARDEPEEEMTDQPPAPPPTRESFDVSDW